MSLFCLFFCFVLFFATRVSLNPILVSPLLKEQSKSYSVEPCEDSTEQPTQVTVKEGPRYSGNNVNLFSRSDCLFVTFVACV